MQTLTQDLRCALRNLGRAPGFAAVVVLTLGLGAVAALALNRFIESRLFNVSALDLVTFVSVSAVLALVALLACLIPALRATRLDPMRALRTE